MTRTSTPRRIAVLFHRNDRRLDLRRYAVTHLAGFWKEDGHHVEFIFGPGRRAEADLVLVHVNLSVVPDAYLEYAARFPVALNGRVRDVRKSVVSRNLVRPGDGWQGPVIVKSDLNYGGEPELALGGWWPRRGTPHGRLVRAVRRRLHMRDRRMRETADYRVFDSIDRVPPEWLGARDVVVERFVPEREGDLYVVRNYLFLGSAHTCERRLSPSPVVNSRSAVRTDQVAPDPEIVALREQMGFDYGKFDYVRVDGRVVLLDANKTVGSAVDVDEDVQRAARRERARGLYAYFE